MEFNDHVRSAGNQRLVRRLNRLARGVGEDVAAAGDLEDLVQKPDAAARINFAQCFRLSSDDQQYAGPGTTANARPHVVKSLLHVADEIVRLPALAGGVAEVAQRLENRVEAAVPVDVGLDARPFELLVEVGLRAVGQHERGAKREDALGIRVEQRANLR